MITNQKHSGPGDNVGGDKITNNVQINLPPSGDLNTLSLENILRDNSSQNEESDDQKDQKVFKDLYPYIYDLVLKEQAKPYGFVPMYVLKGYLKCRGFPENLFDNLIAYLQERKVIDITQIKVCRVYEEL